MLHHHLLLDTPNILLLRRITTMQTLIQNLFIRRFGDDPSLRYLPRADGKDNLLKICATNETMACRLYRGISP